MFRAAAETGAIWDFRLMMADFKMEWERVNDD